MIELNQNMGIWEHVNDLRQVIIRSLVVIFIGFFIAFLLREPLFNLLITHWQPKTSGMFQEQEIRTIKITNTSTTPKVFSVPQEASLPPGQIELQGGQSIQYEIATMPKLLLLGPLEGMLQTFKVCFWLSLATTAPIWGWILISFVLPGLNRQEKLVIFPFLMGSVICILLAVGLAHTVTIPISNVFLQTFNSSIGQNAWSFGNYIDYTLLIYLGHIVAFELALLLFLGAHYGLISSEWMISKRRYIIILAFILGALLTPPDVFTQLMLAIPLIGLFELTVFYAKLKTSWREI